MAAAGAPRDRGSCALPGQWPRPLPASSRPSVTVSEVEGSHRGDGRRRGTAGPRLVCAARRVAPPSPRIVAPFCHRERSRRVPQGRWPPPGQPRDRGSCALPGQWPRPYPRVVAPFCHPERSRRVPQGRWPPPGQPRDRGSCALPGQWPRPYPRVVAPFCHPERSRRVPQGRWPPPGQPRDRGSCALPGQWPRPLPASSRPSVTLSEVEGSHRGDSRRRGTAGPRLVCAARPVAPPSPRIVAPFCHRERSRRVPQGR